MDDKPTKPIITEKVEIKPPLSQTELKKWEIILQNIVEDIQHVEYDTHIWEILPNIYLGDFKCATSSELLHAYEMTHILNCASGSGGCNTSEKFYKEHDLDIKLHSFISYDDEEYDIVSKHAKESIEFMNAALKQEKAHVLVHCMAGMNRSACMIVAYLIAQEKMSLLQAIVHIKSKRKMVLWNESFRRQLIHFAHYHNLLC